MPSSIRSQEVFSLNPTATDQHTLLLTSSLVKQVIGQAEVLPWSQFLKKDDCLDRKPRSQRNTFRFKSPQGGLIAHWLGTVALIAVSASISSTLESIGLAGYIQTYTHCFILSKLKRQPLNKYQI